MNHVEQHLKEAIETAQSLYEPFPHFYIRNVFPKTYYQKLLAMLPEDREYQTPSRGRAADKYELNFRRRFSITGGDLSMLDEEKLTFWNNLASTLCSNWFSQIVFAKFFNEISTIRRTNKFGVNVRLELIRDREGYKILPHTDAPAKYFTLMFYLPRDGTTTNLGTSIYVPKKSQFTDWKSHRLPFELFDEVKKIEFAPNTLFGFMKTDNSFHGRAPIEGMNVQRDWINCSLQASNTAIP